MEPCIRSRIDRDHDICRSTAGSEERSIRRAAEDKAVPRVKRRLAKAIRRRTGTQDKSLGKRARLEKVAKVRCIQVGSIFESFCYEGSILSKVLEPLREPS